MDTSKRVTREPVRRAGRQKLCVGRVQKRRSASEHTRRTTASYGNYITEFGAICPQILLIDRDITVALRCTQAL
jgi:hypothetical protein